MSYRTYVEDVQVFGNHECYPEWIEFIKSQGIAVDEDGCYEGDITDFMGALVTIEKIVLRLNQEREKFKEELSGRLGNKPILSLFDFSNIPEKLGLQAEYYESTEKADPKYGASLFDELYGVVDSSYAFMPYVFYLSCLDKLEATHPFSTDGHFYCYKLKNDEKIHVRAS